MKLPTSLKPQANIVSLIRTLSPSSLAILFVSSASIVVLSFAVPLVALQTYDRVIAYASRDTLAWLCVGCLLALVLNALLEYWRSCLCAWSASRYVLTMDKKLSEAILDASPEAVRRENDFRHLERFRSLSGAAGAILSRFLPIASEVPFALVYLIVLAAIGGWTVIVPIIALLAEFFVALFARPYYLKAKVHAEEAEQKRTAYISFALRRMHFIKAQAMEQAAMGAFEREQAVETDALAQRARLDMRLDEFGRLINGAASFGVMLVGGVLIANGRLTYGAVSACLFFSARLVGIARDFRKGVFLLADASEDLSEQALGLEIPKRTGAGEPSLPRNVQGRLEFAHVDYGSGSIDRLSKLSFTLRPGQAALVCGESNAVRSAICRLAAGILAPDEGQVLLDAYPSSRWDFLSSQGAIGYVSQRSSVLPGSLVDNIAAFDPLRREAALDIAQVLGLEKTISRLPKGFETIIAQGAFGGLSASDLRLVTIARALARRPRLLVWDEADTGLDASASALCAELLSDLAGSMGILINSRAAAFRQLASCKIGPLAALEAAK